MEEVAAFLAGAFFAAGARFGVDFAALDVVFLPDCAEDVLRFVVTADVCSFLAACAVAADEAFEAVAVGLVIAAVVSSVPEMPLVWDTVVVLVAAFEVPADAFALLDAEEAVLSGLFLVAILYLQRAVEN